jgi:hypothetical protein
MDTSRDRWLARCARAICAGSRWASCASLVLAALALAFLYLEPVGPAAAATISVAAAAGAVQVYLAARVEFDRMIFQDIAAAAPDAAGAAGAFDAAAREAGLLPERKAGRDLLQRTAGVLALARAIFGVLLLQLALLIAAAWMSR